MRPYSPALADGSVLICRAAILAQVPSWPGSTRGLSRLSRAVERIARAWWCCSAAVVHWSRVEEPAAAYSKHQHKYMLSAVSTTRTCSQPYRLSAVSEDAGLATQHVHQRVVPCDLAEHYDYRDKFDRNAAKSIRLSSREPGSPVAPDGHRGLRR